MDYQELLSRHNPPEPSQWPIGYGDFRRFFWKYKGLATEQARNNAFWEATNENLRTSYERLDEQEREIERAYNMNQLYLDNIREGLLIVDRDFTILDQYSRFLTGLFRTERIKGRNIVDFLFPDAKNQAQDRKELGKFVSILFSSISAEMEMLEDINPLREKRLTVRGDDGSASEIVVSAGFSRIMKGEDVEHVIFIFDDLTGMVKMQKELEYEKSRYQAENESISAILRVGPKAFLEFLDESSQIIGDFESNLYALNQSAILHRLFRQVHSLKGSAKYLELNHVAGIANRIEDDLTKIINHKMEPDDACTTNLTGLLNNLYAEFENIASLIEKFKQFSDLTINARQVKAPSDTESFFTSLKRMTEKIAAELGKSAQLKINNTVGSIPFLEKIKNPLIHLIRNALDHGVEDSYERLARKKPTQATIELKIAREGDQILIEVIDDGQGIDFNQIRKKAIERHYFKTADNSAITDARLLNLIFTPNFSSRDVITELSGRGFGLDVVRDAVKSLKGKISVSTTPHRGTRFNLRIPE
jgi:signal transduction histidine kinase